MIIVGDKKEFAIAAEISELLQGWLLGKFAFIFHGRSCGNWSDAADLRGCYSWLKDFAEHPRNRFEPGLMEQSTFEIFRRLVRTVSYKSNQNSIPEIYTDTFGRFHITHLGMSSFDRFRLIFIEDSHFQRCVWQDLSNEEIIYDDLYPHGHMQNIASKFCKEFEQLLEAMGVDLKFNPNNDHENRTF